MYRLQKKYEGKTAVVIFAGPSVIESGIDLGDLKEKNFTIFLDTKALTPWFLKHGFQPDFYMMPYPDKSKDNSLQHYIYRSFMSRVNIKYFLKKQHLDTYWELKNNFQQYFESWKPERGIHKKYRWKKDVYMENSPYALLSRIPDAKIISNKREYTSSFSTFPYLNEFYYYDFEETLPAVFDLDSYFNPIVRDDVLRIMQTGFLNSAAISLYPMLNFMGFNEIYFLGMDMTMFGSFEYAALYTFKSMIHFQIFFHMVKHTLNDKYITNKPFYLRPPDDFKNGESAFAYDKIEFYRVTDPFKYCAKTDYIQTITYDEFMANN